MKHIVHRDHIKRYLKLSAFLQNIRAVPKTKNKLGFNDWDTNLNIKSIGINPADPTGPYVLLEYK